MSALNNLCSAPRSKRASILVTQFVLAGALFGVSQGQAASSAMELARRDSSQMLQKSPGGQITRLEPIGECRDPLAGNHSTTRRSVLIMANSKSLPSMRKDRNGWEQALRRSPVTNASLIIREVQHQREVVVGQLEGLYLVRGYNNELRVSGTLDEMGSDGVYETKSINFPLSADASSFASFAGPQVFECRLTHPQLIRFEQP